MGKQNGLQKRLISFLSENPTQLYVITEVMEEFDIDRIAAMNALYNSHRSGRIMRHKDKVEKGHQYALTIPDHLNDPYVKVHREGSQTFSKPAKRKKGQMPTSREIRTMFAQTQNQMAKMEDMMIAVVEEAEELEKMMNKIRNITS